MGLNALVPEFRNMLGTDKTNTNSDMSQWRHE